MNKAATLSMNQPGLLAAAAGLAALAIVGSAWIFQLIGYVPCQVCLWQRIPYYIAGPLLLAVGAFAFMGLLPARTVNVLVVIGAVIIATSGLIGIYHSGVEWGFWPGPASCGVGGTFTASEADDLFNSLESTKPPACDEAAGRFLGLSFAGWNVVAAFGLAGVMTWATKRSRSRSVGV
ncbi:MAG: disulfide bond formation protein B [Pseudomonadota bacterium]